MKAFDGYDNAKKEAQASGSKRLPAGGYVVKILGVRYQPGENGNSDMIRLQFDIIEGEFKNFFQDQYEANTSEDKKYKGNATVYVPKDDGSQKDGWTKRSFAGWTSAFEQSNPGYAWDWDEKKWKDKVVGLVFGETGTVIDGKEIVYTEARYAVPAEDIRNNNYKPAKFKAKNGYGEGGNGGNGGNSGSGNGWLAVPSGVEEDLPFN